MADNKSIIFYKSWWIDRLQYMPKDKLVEILSRFLDHVCGLKSFDPDAFSRENIPNEIELELIAMVKLANADEEKYQNKCQTNSNNRKQSVSTDNDRKRPITTDNENGQSRTIVNDGDYYKNKNKNKNNFFHALCAREADASQKEKKELLYRFSFYLLSEGVLNAYSTAEKAIQFNEARNWKSTNAQGSTSDWSYNKLEYLKGWNCERSCFAKTDGALFSEICQAAMIDSPVILDSFKGIIHAETSTQLIMTSKRATRLFLDHFKNKTELINAVGDVLQANNEQINFTAIYEQ